MPSRILIVDDEEDNIEILKQMLLVSDNSITDLGLEEDSVGRVNTDHLDEDAFDKRAHRLLEESVGAPEVDYASGVEDALTYIRDAQEAGKSYQAIIVDFNLDEIHGEQLINLLLGRLGPMLCGPGEETPDLSKIKSFKDLYDILSGVDYTARDFLENNFESPADVVEFADTVDKNPPYLLIFSGCYLISSTDPEIKSRFDYVQKGPDCEAAVLEALVARRLIDKVPDREEFKKFIDPDHGFMSEEYDD